MKNPEKGDTVTTYYLNGKVAEKLIYDGEKWEKPPKTRKPRNKKPKNEYEQISLF